MTERSGKLKSWKLQQAAGRLWYQLGEGLGQRPFIVGALRLAFRAGVARGVRKGSR